MELLGLLVKRHAATVVASSVLLGLLAVIGAYSVQQIKAEARRAERHAEEARHQSLVAQAAREAEMGARKEAEEKASLAVLAERDAVSAKRDAVVARTNAEDETAHARQARQRAESAERAERVEKERARAAHKLAEQSARELSLALQQVQEAREIAERQAAQARAAEARERATAVNERKRREWLMETYGLLVPELAE